MADLNLDLSSNWMSGGVGVKAENFKICLTCFEILFGAFKNVRVIPGTFRELAG